MLLESNAMSFSHKYLCSCLFISLDQFLPVSLLGQKLLAFEC